MGNRFLDSRSTPQENSVLAELLGDEPHSIFARQLVQRGLCPAFLIGDPVEPVGCVSVVVEARPGLLYAFGEDTRSLWALIKRRVHSTRAIVAPQQAQELGALIERATGRSVCYEETRYFILPAPVVRHTSLAVRLMTVADVDLVANGPGGAVGAAYGSLQALLAEGCVAGAVRDGKLVTRAHTSCQSPRYADVAIATAPPWRGQGLASAAASLVCKVVQQSGRVPVWSTAAENTASQRIAQKLGFVLYTQMSSLTLAASID